MYYLLALCFVKDSHISSIKKRKPAGVMAIVKLEAKYGSREGRSFNIDSVKDSGKQTTRQGHKGSAKQEELFSKSDPVTKWM